MAAEAGAMVPGQGSSGKAGYHAQGDGDEAGCGHTSARPAIIPPAEKADRRLTS